MNEHPLVSLRPRPKRKFDQFGVTEKTLEERSNFLASRGFITDSKILFLGDYDLTSLAALPLTKNCEIWVLDADTDVLDVIKKESKGTVSSIEHNLLNPLPKRSLESFDFIFTDPPYTPEGVSLFLSRAIDALSREKDSKIILSYGSLDPVRALAVQNKILEHGVLIKELLPQFNEYLDAKTVGNASDLYVLGITERTKPIIRGVYGGKVYTHE